MAKKADSIKHKADKPAFVQGIEKANNEDANPKVDKFSGLCLKYKIWLEHTDGTSIMGDGKYLLLKTIEKEGSLMAAIEKLKLDYRRTWGNLKKIEKLLGFNLLQRTRGGKDGGQTTLTEDGKKLILAFDEFHLKMDSLFNTAFKEFHQKLK